MRPVVLTQKKPSGHVGEIPRRLNAQPRLEIGVCIETFINLNVGTSDNTEQKKI